MLDGIRPPLIKVPINRIRNFDKWKYLIAIFIIFLIILVYEVKLFSFSDIHFLEHLNLHNTNASLNNSHIIEKIIYRTKPREYNPNMLSFLNTNYYQNKIFNSKQNDNKFLNPYIDFMSFKPKKTSKYRFNYLYFDHNYNNPQIIHCSGIQKAGIGNFLAQYWAARSIAFWLGYNFKMVENNKDKRCWQDNFAINEMFEKYFNANPDHKYWNYYLPKYINTSIYDNDTYKLTNTDRNRIYIWITQSIIQIAGDAPKKYCYKSLYRLFYYNPIFINILISDTKHALNLYFSPPENNSNILPQPVFNSKTDVVIHFRCGDILSAGGTEYGFMTLSFYQKAFDIIWNELNIKFSADTKIWFLSQLGDNSLRSNEYLGVNNLERKNKNGCNKVVYKYVEELQKLVYPVNITINGNNPLNVDFYKMVYAPVLICSMSTFCEQAGHANTNNVILPIWGPWNDMKEMIDGNIWYPENVHFIKNSQTNYTLTSGVVKKTKMSEDQIVEYLITH